jgi:hypothetical protein
MRLYGRFLLGDVDGCQAIDVPGQINAFMCPQRRTIGRISFFRPMKLLNLTVATDLFREDT